MYSEIFSFFVYSDQYAHTFSSINMFLKGPDDFSNCHLLAYAAHQKLYSDIFLSTVINMLILSVV